MNIEQLTQRITDCENRLCDLENNRSPEALHQKQAMLLDMIENQMQIISEFSARFKAMDGDDTYIEEFTDEKLRYWYDISGLMTKDVKLFIENIIGSEISPSAVSQYVNGQIGSIKVRSKMGKWFRTNAIKKNPKVII